MNQKTVRAYISFFGLVTENAIALICIRYPSTANPVDNSTMNTRWKPSATVAAIIEQDGKFLLVEEHTPEGLRLNNPAGHLDEGESPVMACARETLEETMYLFTPTHLLGVYFSRFKRPAHHHRPAEDVTYLRFAFCGQLGAIQTGRNLDKGIVRTLWFTPEQMRASAERHRSPLILQCMEDYLSGQRYPLAVVHTDPSVALLQPNAGGAT